MYCIDFIKHKWGVVVKYRFFKSQKAFGNLPNFGMGIVE